MELFKLLGTIAIDNQDANAQIEGTTEKAEKSESKISSAFKKIGTAVVTYFAVDKVVDFGKACVNAAADANAAASQFTQVFGDLEGEASANLSKIAADAGIMETRMKGSYTKIAAFAKTTGMDTADALSLADRAMIAVADSAAFYDRSLEDTTESLQSFLKGNFENDAALGLSCTEVTRNAAAMKLFGAEYKELSEQQKQLTLLQMVEDANKLSGAIGQAARESDTWTNQTGNLQQAWTDFKAMIGSNFLEGAVGGVKKASVAVQRLSDFVSNLFEMWREIVQPSMGAVGRAMEGLGLAFKPVFQGFQSMLPASVQADGALGLVRDVCYWLEEALLLVSVKIQTFAGYVMKYLPEAQAFFEKMWEVCQHVWDTIGQPIWDMLQKAIEIVRNAFAEKMPEIMAFVSECFADIKTFWEQNLKPCLEAIGDFIENILAPAFEFVFNEFIVSAVDTAFEFIKDMWNNTLKPILVGITDFLTGVFTGNWRQAFQGLINIVKGVFSGLKNVVKTPINQVINLVNSFIQGLNKLKIPDWVPAVGGKGINIPLIPKLEKGGILKKGQMGLLEGSGDEAVVPLHQNRAWISAVAKDMKTETGADSGKLQQIIDMLTDFFPQFVEASGHDIVTNDGVLIAHYAPKLNQELGKIYTRKDRGR